MLHPGVHEFAQGSGIEISRRPFHEKHCLTLRNALGQLSTPALAESLLMHSSSSPPIPPTLAFQSRSFLAAPRALRTLKPKPETRSQQQFLRRSQPSARGALFETERADACHAG